MQCVLQGVSWRRQAAMGLASNSGSRLFAPLAANAQLLDVSKLG
jgi:hypothetical protein